MLINLPFPDKSLNPNHMQGVHWSKTNKIREDARNEGSLCARVAMQDQIFEPADTYAVTIHFYPPDKQHRDMDNMLAAMKHYLDGVCLRLEINDHQFKIFTLILDKVWPPVGLVSVEIVPIQTAENIWPDKNP